MVHNLFEANTAHVVSLWSKSPRKCVTKYLTLLEITVAHLAFGFWRLIHARLGVDGWMVMTMMSVLR